MTNKSNWGEALFILTTPHDDPATLLIGGRDRWALECLIAAGADGCTPIESPGPRWSAYVHNLRTMGIPIETVTEKHGGPFSGTHARYVLRAKVQRRANVGVE